MPKYVWNGPEDEVFEWKGFTYASGEPVPMTVEDYVAEVRSGVPLEPYEAEDSGPAKVKSPDPAELVAEKEAQDEENRRLAEENQARLERNLQPVRTPSANPVEGDPLGLTPNQRAGLEGYGYSSDQSIRDASDEDLRAAGLSDAAIGRVRSHG